ncbi:MAG TPA: hypothetical protein EYP22_10860 [Methanosarcinales archaeon]|nr:hypothetical protein [Methanosarcinales archaeon]
MEAFTRDHEIMRDRYLFLSQQYYNEASARTEDVHMYSSYALSAACLVVAFDHAVALVTRLEDAPRHKHTRHLRQLGKFKRLDSVKRKKVANFLEDIEVIRNRLLYLRKISLNEVKFIATTDLKKLLRGAENVNKILKKL